MKDEMLFFLVLLLSTFNSFAVRNDQQIIHNFGYYGIEMFNRAEQILSLRNIPYRYEHMTLIIQAPIDEEVYELLSNIRANENEQFPYIFDLDNTISSEIRMTIVSLIRNYIEYYDEAPPIYEVYLSEIRNVLNI